MGTSMGFRGKRVGEANCFEFLAPQRLNHSTKHWEWGDLRWMPSAEGCWNLIPPGRASERRKFRCLLCRCNLQGNGIQDLISNGAVGGGA